MRFSLRWTPFLNQPDRLILLLTYLPSTYSSKHLSNHSLYFNKSSFGFCWTIHFLNPGPLPISFVLLEWCLRARLTSVTHYLLHCTAHLKGLLSAFTLLISVILPASGQPCNTVRPVSVHRSALRQCEPCMTSLWRDQGDDDCNLRETSLEKPSVIKVRISVSE